MRQIGQMNLEALNRLNRWMVEPCEHASDGRLCIIIANATFHF